MRRPTPLVGGIPPVAVCASYLRPAGASDVSHPWLLDVQPPATHEPVNPPARHVNQSTRSGVFHCAGFGLTYGEEPGKQRVSASERGDVTTWGVHVTGQAAGRHLADGCL